MSTADLIQRLRTCSAEERIAVAMGLTDVDVEALIDLLDGTKYATRDKLSVVDALGETHSVRALDYLKQLAVHTPPTSETEEGDYGGSSGDYGGKITMPTGSFSDADFPNAKGELKLILGSSRAEVEACRTHQIDDDPDNEYTRLESAIKKLETALQNHPGSATPQTPSDSITHNLVGDHPYRDEHGMER